MHALYQVLRGSNYSTAAAACVGASCTFWTARLVTLVWPGPGLPQNIGLRIDLLTLLFLGEKVTGVVVERTSIVDIVGAPCHGMAWHGTTRPVLGRVNMPRFLE